MSVPTNQYKLGLFVLVGLAAVVLVAVGLGARSMQKETVTYYTYFDESVQGLDVGSPVKFRGVTIGSVAKIEVAPNHRHVEVAEELDVRDIKRLGLVETRDHGGPLQKPRFLVPPDLRVRLATQGITGVKFITMDFVDPATSPPPPLPFPTKENYIPSATSVLKNLEDTVATAAAKVPDLVDALMAATSRIDRVVAKLEKDDLSEKTSAVLARGEEVLGSLLVTVKRIEQSGMADKVGSTLDDIRTALHKMNGILDLVDGEGGLVASAQRVTDSFGKSADGTTKELDSTMREIREAAEAIRLLADALERDPDMLVKGRAAAKGRSR